MSLVLDSTYTQPGLLLVKSEASLGPISSPRTCSLGIPDPPGAFRCLDERGRGNENEKNGIVLGGESRRRDQIPSTPDAARASEEGREIERGIPWSGGVLLTEQKLGHRAMLHGQGDRE